MNTDDLSEINIIIPSDRTDLRILLYMLLGLPFF